MKKLSTTIAGRVELATAHTFELADGRTGTVWGLAPAARFYVEDMRAFKRETAHVAAAELETVWLILDAPHGERGAVVWAVVNTTTNRVLRFVPVEAVTRRVPTGARLA